MKNDFDEMERLEKTLGVEIASFGLPPNPNGYSFVITNYALWDNSTIKDKKELCLLYQTAKSGYL